MDLSNLVSQSTNQQSRKGIKNRDSGEGKVSSNKIGNSVNEQSKIASCLPLGLTLGEIRCAQRHKDSHLYAYLVTTEQGSSGPSLVFCNSIAAVRRVGATLKTLGLPVKMLHAQMAQVSLYLRKMVHVDYKERNGADESQRSR